MMKAFNNAATDVRGGWQPSLGLELALAEVLDAPAESGPSLPSTPPPSATVHAQPQSVADTRQSTPAPQAQSPRKPAQSESVQEETNVPPRDEVQTSRPAEKPAISAADIIKAWKRLTASLPKAQANLSALLNSVKMIDVQGGTLILGLASDVLVSKINQPDQIELIQKLIEDEFGVDMNVRCVVTTAKGKIPPNIPQDGMVAAAIQHGGQIVDM
jgi:hypothetical protein